MSKIKTYKNFPIILGAVGNTEWWVEKDWDIYNKHVQTLKEGGEYLKTVYIDISIVENNLFDSSKSKLSDNPFESYRMVFLDFSNYE